MPVTIGRYEYTLDTKNRLVIPASYRDALIAEKGRSFVLASGLDGCLWLLLPSQWESIQADMREASAGVRKKENVRAFRRQLYSSAEEVELDEQGRVLIPQTLKTHARLRKEVVILGAGNKAEIWDRARWKNYSRSQAVPSYQKLAKELDL